MRVRTFLLFGAFFLFLYSGNVLSQNIGQVLSVDNSIPIYYNSNKKGKKEVLKLEVIDHKYYKIGYWDKHKQSAWVAYLLTREMVEGKKATRSNKFRMDKKLSTRPISSSDYTKSGYDRGHICPSADMSFSQDAQDMTFLMSNISPQLHSFNAGKWKQLEEKVRQWAIENDSIIVISGPILDSIKGKIGKNNISVPYSFYKIIIDISYPDYKAIGFIMPNKKLDQNLYYYSLTIRQVEEAIGMDFFPNLSRNKLISELETRYSDFGLRSIDNKVVKNKKNTKNVKKAKTSN
ncbi:MAG: DNA/RNA non-specific endonuclease [Bacteroidales bacterium]|nr:DNA/RNA non-specific endonuclease [Bacteroidales bacterium]